MPKLRHLTCMLLVFASSCLLFASGQGTDEISFSRDVRPILSDKCFSCHGPDPESREDDLRLDLREDAIADRGGYGVVVPGDVKDSEIWYRITVDDPDEVMPPANSHKELLTPEQINIIRKWIEQGAKYENHWAFTLPIKTPGDIDSFIRTKLTSYNLDFNQPANTNRLLRRIFLDLTGLPPTTEESAKFLAMRGGVSEWLDTFFNEDPFQSRYAERMATPWIDASRYADTIGIHTDAGRQMWLWRDWVLDAYKNNMPFDQFLTEQIAGDLIPNASISQQIASGFNRNHVITDEGGAIDEEYLVEYAVDRTNTMGSIFLGLNLGCARCHDHKYDPITQADYFSLFSYFNSNDEPGLYSQLANSNRAFEPFIEVPNAEQSIQKNSLNDQLKDIETAKQTIDAADEAKFNEFKLNTKTNFALDWSVWNVDSARSENGTTLTILEDQSVLSSGDNPDKEIIQIDLTTNAIDQNLVLLEVLQDESLPHGRVGRAANGNAVLSYIEAECFSISNPEESKQITFEAAWADHEQKNLDFNAVNAINQDLNRGWAVNAHHTDGGRLLLLKSDKAFGFEEGTKISLRLHYQSIYGQHSFGKVRLSSSSISTTSLDQLPIAWSRWYATWPYKAHDNDAGYDTTFGPELEASFDFTKQFAPDDYSWVFRGDIKDAVVNSQLPSGKNISFAGKEFYVPSDRDLMLSLGSDDGIQVFVDGKQIFENRVDRGAAPDQEQLSIPLTAGKHTIICKVVNTGGKGGLYFKELASDGILQESLIWASFNDQLLSNANTEIYQEMQLAWRLQKSPAFRALLENEATFKERLANLQSEIPLTMVMQELAEPRQAFVLKRGEYDKADPDRPVSRGVPTALGELPKDAPSDRRGLAQWLTEDSNPLVARVTVNRLWELMFGRGLVATSTDFGMQGAWPSHPRLLDWLAVEFQESGWDIQHILKLIISSRTYQQSSSRSEDILAADPNNTLLACYPRRRLSSEMIRDQALALSGLLVEKYGGAPVKPYQPEGLWKEVAMPQSNTRIFQQGESEDLWRRSLYTYWKRASPPPSMLLLDSPTREFCSPSRTITNTPLQTLALWNDTQFVEAARAFAQNHFDKSFNEMFLICTGRIPSPKELSFLEETYSHFLGMFQQSANQVQEYLAIGEYPIRNDVPNYELAAKAVVASVLLTLDEVLTHN